MRAANHRSQHLTSASTGFAEYETPIPEQTRCPLIGKDIPLSSCEERRDKISDHPYCVIDQTTGECLAKKAKKPKMSEEGRRKNIEANRNRAQTLAARVKAETIADLYRSGMGVMEIARTLQCARELVSDRLTDAGIERRDRNRSSVYRDKIYAALEKDADYPLNALAQKLGCSMSTVKRYAKELIEK